MLNPSKIKDYHGVAKLILKQEFLHEVRWDILPLIEDHSVEVEDKNTVDPDWETYKDLENNGALRIFTCRDGKKLVGYAVFVVTTGLNDLTQLYAQNIVLFLDKEYRKGLMGLKLIKFAEKCLMEDGVHSMSISVRNTVPFDPLLKRNGYEPLERVWTKKVGS